MAEQDMRAWALKGAEQRLFEMAEEAKAIYAAFPELRDRGGAENRAPRPGRPRKEDAGGTSEAPQKRRRRKMSKEARRKISEAQKARWAKQSGQSADGVTQQHAAPAQSTEAVRKRTMSAEARRRIGAAQRKRWRTQKAAGKSASSSKASK